MGTPEASPETDQPAQTRTSTRTSPAQAGLTSGKSISASNMALRTATLLVMFSTIFTALLAGIYSLAQPRIESVVKEHKIRLLGSVLPASLYNNNLLADTFSLPPTSQLGLDEPSSVYRARRDGKPVALVLEVVATNGYAGRIVLLVAISIDGELIGVRTVQHKETPGLGDYIDIKKDKNKSRPWMEQFNGHSLQDPDAAGWRVSKDGGVFDARAGATITARAVVEAVHRALTFASAEQKLLYSDR